MRSLQIMLATFGVLTVLTLTEANATAFSGGSGDHGHGGHGYGGHGYGGHGYGGHGYGGHGYGGHGYGGHGYGGHGYGGHGYFYNPGHLHQQYLETRRGGNCRQDFSENMRGRRLPPNGFLPGQNPNNRGPQGQQRPPSGQNRRVAPNAPNNPGNQNINPGNQNVPQIPGRKLSPQNVPHNHDSHNHSRKLSPQNVPHNHDNHDHGRKLSPQNVPQIPGRKLSPQNVPHNHDNHDHGRKVSPQNVPPVPGSLNPQGTEKPNQKLVEIPDNVKGIALLPKADQAAALAQKTCPVTGDLLGSDGKPLSVQVGGRTIFVCCSDCVDEVKANPEKFLKKLS